MIRNRWSLSLRVCLLMSLASVWSLGECRAEEPLDEAIRAEVIKDLEAKWKTHRELLKTVQVKFRRYRNGGDFIESPPERFDAEWQKLKLATNPDGLTVLFEELTGKPPHVIPPFSKGNFFWDATRLREQTNSWDILNDGELELIKENQRDSVKVYLPGVGESRWMHSTLPEYRFVPSPAFLRAHQFRVTKKDGDEVELVSKNGEVRMKTKSESGHVSRLETIDESGTVKSQLRQEEWRQHTGGVSFPSVTCQARYSNGNLEMLTFIRIDEAEVNEVLPASSFKMGIEKGGLIHDRRPGKKQEFRAPDQTDDIRTLIGTEETLGATKPRSILRLAVWLVSANVAAVGAVIWWRRRTDQSDSRA